MYKPNKSLLIQNKHSTKNSVGLIQWLKQVKINKHNFTSTSHEVTNIYTNTSVDETIRIITDKFENKMKTR